jgi:Pyruvate/2-oxoacid:ferredoxin oxidoreductase gamma subunit
MVMLGALDGCKILPFQPHALEESISIMVPKKMIDANLKAFELGRASVSSNMQMAN